MRRRPWPDGSHYQGQTKLPRMLRQAPSFQLPGGMTEGVKPDDDRFRIVPELKLELDLALRNRKIAKTARISGPWPSPGSQRDLSRESPLPYSLLSLPPESLLLHTGLYSITRADLGGGTLVEPLDGVFSVNPTEARVDS